MIPYGRQTIDEDDINAVVEVLRSDWLTTGPKIAEFEQAFAKYVDAEHAVAVSSGTAALHAAMYALEIEPGDEVIVPAMTFASTANCIVFQGGTPIFCDVDPNTLLIDVSLAKSKITSSTKAIIAADYTGQPCEYDELQAVADEHGLAVVADACHSLGGKYKERPVGSLADLSVFSFHPVKHITTGEGGMITTNDNKLAGRMRTFRNHGITADHHQREAVGSWFYEMIDLGYNYRITDFQCALGQSQLQKLSDWVSRRREIARLYEESFSDVPVIQLLSTSGHFTHSYHLYVIQFRLEHLRCDRDFIFRDLRQRGIGVNVHYIPVHLHPFYRNRFGTGLGMCPEAELAYRRVLSLPIFPKMSNTEVRFVIEALLQVIGSFCL